MEQPSPLMNPVVSRIISVLMLTGTGGVLGIAWWLDPSPSGHSTHLQLGLRPCSFFAWTGIPCPMCGMTTTFAHMADLRVVDAVVTQPFGVMLFLLTVILFGIAAAELLQPKLRWERVVAWASQYELRLTGFFVFALIAGWLYKIAVMT